MLEIYHLRHLKQFLCKGDAMNSEVVVALIGLIGSVLVQFGGIMVNSKLTNYRVEQVEKKIDKLTDSAAEIYTLKQEIAILKTRLSQVEKEDKE